MNNGVLVCAALVKTVLLYPLETLKTRMVLDQCEFMDAWQNLFLGLGPQWIYSGLIPALVVPIIASTIGTFTAIQVKYQLLPTRDIAKTHVRDVPIASKHDPLPELIRKTPRIPDVFQTPIEILSYGVSGAIVAALTCPFTVVQLALQLKSTVYINAWDAVTSLVRNGGWRPLFYGFVPHLLHSFVYRASLYAIFCILKTYFSLLRTKSEKNMPRAFKEYMKRLHLSRFRTIDILVSLLISGMFAACISSPFGVVTTAYQSSRIEGKNLSIREVIVQIYNHGFVRFYSGLLPYAVQTGLGGILSFLLVKIWTREPLQEKSNTDSPRQTFRDVADQTWSTVTEKISQFRINSD